MFPVQKTKVHPYYNRYTFFATQLNHHDWSKDTVLDFGGSAGNLLKDPESTITPENYYCLDVVPEAIEEGKILFPTANWLHYNRWNFSYNPGGDKSCSLPSFDVKFNLIVAYSVFSHTSKAEMQKTVEELRNLLNPGGRIVFTVVSDNPGAQYFFRKRAEKNPGIDVNDLIERTRQYRWFYLINDNDIVGEEDGFDETLYDRREHLIAAYKMDFFRTLYPHAKVIFPIKGHIQHLVVLGD